MPKRDIFKCLSLNYIRKRITDLKRRDKDTIITIKYLSIYYKYLF